MPHRSYFLELTTAQDFCPAPFSIKGVSTRLAQPADWARCQSLWREVGRGFWTERQNWTPDVWKAHLKQARVRLKIAELRDEDIGFFELQRTDGDVKLEGFGLLPTWRGRSLGAGLLTMATQAAFDFGARRIWLHTATDDHPHALPNYLKRGYRIYHEEPLADPME